MCKLALVPDSRVKIMDTAVVGIGYYFVLCYFGEFSNAVVIALVIFLYSS